MTFSLGCGKWCLSKTDPLHKPSRLPGNRYLVNSDRVCRVDNELKVHVLTSARDDIQAVFNKYSTYLVCEKIIYNFTSNGNEARHGLVHRFVGNKRVMFARGLVSRAQLHTILRYDQGVDVMLTTVLSECGLPVFNQDVLNSFKMLRRQRAQNAKVQGNPLVMMKRKYDAMVARGQAVRRDRGDEEPGHSAGQAIFDNGEQAASIIKKRKTIAVRRCSRCKRQGHSKRKCPIKTGPSVDPKKVLPGLSVAVPLTSLNSVVLVFIDIECTSGSVYDLEVVQIACDAVRWPAMTSSPIKNSKFNMFATHKRPVSGHVRRKLSGMDWDGLANAPPFKDILQRLFAYLKRVGTDFNSIVLVAHNGKPFDLPALFNAANEVGIDLFENLRTLNVAGLCDTLVVVRADAASKSDKGVGLAALFNETLLRVPRAKTFNAHDAAEDVDALLHIVTHNERFRRFRDAGSLDKVVLPLPLLNQYCQAMKDEYWFGEQQMALALKEESEPGWTAPVLVPKKAKKLNSLNAKAPKRSRTSKDAKTSALRCRRRSSASTASDGESDAGDSESDASSLHSAESSETMHNSCNQSTLSDGSNDIHMINVDMATASTRRSSRQISASSTPNSLVSEPLKEQIVFAVPSKKDRTVTAKKISTVRRQRQTMSSSNRGSSGNAENPIDVDCGPDELPAVLEVSQTKPQARVARSLKLSTRPISLPAFVSSNGVISTDHGSSFERLQECLRDIISRDPSSIVMECAKNLNVRADMVNCLLERLPGQDIRMSFLNSDIINSISAVLSTRHPLCSITSTYVGVWALETSTTIESKCSRLKMVDFDNDNIFFPIHHKELEHWSLVRLHWSGECWEVYYIDSLFSQETGNKYCDAIVEMVQSYLTIYRQKFADAAVLKRGKRLVMVGRDSAKNSGRASARFERHELSSTCQTDGYNCGCYMLHHIESVLNRQTNWTVFPNSQEYFAAYRRRLLLMLWTFDGI